MMSDWNDRSDMDSQWSRDDSAFPPVQPEHPLRGLTPEDRRKQQMDSYAMRLAALTMALGLITVFILIWKAILW